MGSIIFLEAFSECLVDGVVLFVTLLRTNLQIQNGEHFSLSPSQQSYEWKYYRFQTKESGLQIPK